MIQFLSRLIKTIQKWDNYTKIYRLIVFVVLFGSCFLFIRLVSLQLVDAQGLKNKNLMQVNEPRVLMSPRGTIFDRNGHPLAMSIMTKSLYVDPTMLNITPAQLADEIGPYVKISKEEIIKRAQEKTAFVWLDRMMDPDKSKAVEDIIKKDKIEGLAFKKESRRFYPNSTVLAQVLGFVGSEDKGLDGLEMVLENDIKGEPYHENILTDGKGRPILNSIASAVIPKKERTVTLTIDTTIQFIAERALDQAMKETKAQGASIIIMDPKTGDILAMANRPTYDPNDISKMTEREFKNRAVTNVYEPGSTFKPIIAAAALDSGKWDVNRVFHDVGYVIANGHKMQNWNGEGYGDVRLVDILKFSINTGMAHIGLITGPDILTKYVKRFGFGSVTGIELPGEQSGILFNPKDMADIDTASMSIGQGIAVTPLQMVRAFGALANGGIMMQPHIIKSINNPDGSIYKETKPKEVGRPISPAVDKTIVDILEKEVGEGGGHKAYVEGYHFAGKTGTAQKLNTEHGGYLNGRYIASFIGFGPVEDPKFVALIVIDDPEGVFYGGQIAAPVFKNIMEQLVRYYQISPSVSKEVSPKDLPKPFEYPAVKKDDKGGVIIPDFTGWTTGEVRNWLHQAGLGFIPDGTGYAISQDQMPGDAVPIGAAISVHFSR